MGLDPAHVTLKRIAAREMRALEGIPLGVKDSVPTAGVRTIYGFLTA